MESNLVFFFSQDSVYSVWPDVVQMFCVCCIVIESRSQLYTPDGWRPCINGLSIAQESPFSNEANDAIWRLMMASFLFIFQITGQEIDRDADVLVFMKSNMEHEPRNIGGAVPSSHIGMLAPWLAKLFNTSDRTKNRLRKNVEDIWDNFLQPLKVRSGHLSIIPILKRINKHILKGSAQHW